MQLKMVIRTDYGPVPGPDEIEFVCTPVHETEDGRMAYARVIFSSDVASGLNRWDRVVTMATSYGFKRRLPRDLALYEIETAVAYLNEQAPDGWRFGFLDGAFCLGNPAWWSWVTS